MDISDLKGEQITGTFSEKELQKTSQKDIILGMRLYNKKNHQKLLPFKTFQIISNFYRYSNVN